MNRSTETRSRLPSLLAGAICICAAALGAPPATAAEFSNPSPITINDAALATPYPSTITVSGLGPKITDVNATLSGFNHLFPADMDILLVGPQGQNVMLMSDAPQGQPLCDNDVAGLSLTFDDAAAGTIPSGVGLASGTYRPTNNNPVVPDCGAVSTDTFAAPAPGGPYGSTLAELTGTNPNGTWSLYALDDQAGDSGSIANGWRLEIKTPNDFSFGKVKRNKHKGTALLAVNVPGPGTLSLAGKGIKTVARAGVAAGAVASKTVSAEGALQLRVKAKGKKKRKLNDTGKVKVKANVTYTPTGGDPNTESKPVKLIDVD